MPIRRNLACGAYMNSAEGGVRLRRARALKTINRATATRPRPTTPATTPPAIAPLLTEVVTAFSGTEFIDEEMGDWLD